MSRRVASLLPIAVAVALVGSAAPSAAVLDGADTTPPTITPTVTGTSGAGGWYTSAVSVSWSVADAESAIASTSGCDPVTLGADTTGTTITCSATNADGLAATNSVSVKIDTTPPAASGGSVGPPASKGWYTQPVNVAFSGSDAISGIASCTASFVYSGPDSKNASVGGACTNGAGLTTPAVASFKYDASPPAIAAHLSGTQGANGWFRSDVSVSWDVSDPHSGVASTSGCGPATVSGDTAGTTITCAGTNDAGLTGQASVLVRIDRTPPDTSITSGPSGTVVSSGASFDLSSSEAGSSFECSLDGGSFGSCSSPASYANLADGGHSLAVRAVDQAGNADGTPASRSWTVRSAVPILKVPADQVVEATSAAGAVVTFAVSAQDGADPLPPDAISCTPKSGSTFKLGSTTVVCTATNSLGATAKASWSVTVRDTSAPRLTVPAALTLTAGAPVAAANANIAAFLAGARAVDLVDPVPTVATDAPGVFPLGTTVVTFTAKDASGNTTSAKSSLTLAVPGTPAAAGAPPAGTSTGATPSRVDRTPPGDVQNVTALSGDRSVSLSWRRPSDADFDHVDVLRAEARSGSEEIRIYSGAKLEVVDKGVANGVQYRYVVVAVDVSGNRAGGVAVVASPQASLLVSPKDTARLKRPPKLRWKRVAGATYYNVQLWRDGVKLLSFWPIRTSLQLKRRWSYQGRRYVLTPGTYRWYVWPGLGARADVRYGTILGRQTFTLTR